MIAVVKGMHRLGESLFLEVEMPSMGRLPVVGASTSRKGLSPSLRLPSTATIIRDASS